MRRFLAIVVAVGLLVVGAAIAAADVCAPAKVTDLAVSAMGKSTVVLTCTAPGDDCSTGTAATFEIRASQSGPITESNYYNATVILTGTAPTGGTNQCYAVDTPGTLTCGGHTYYFSITFTDAAGIRSPVSNSPNGTTRACNQAEVSC